ncbi:MAG: hypothetical protein JWM95_2294 [Gemmatimonadetes bacterium]|nr:hypothetical protein [Gemmatimonadota bacterium]
MTWVGLRVVRQIGSSHVALVTSSQTRGNYSTRRAEASPVITSRRPHTSTTGKCLSPSSRRSSSRPASSLRRGSSGQSFFLRQIMLSPQQASPHCEITTASGLGSGPWRRLSLAHTRSHRRLALARSPSTRPRCPTGHTQEAGVVVPGGAGAPKLLCASRRSHAKPHPSFAAPARLRKRVFSMRKRGPAICSDGPTQFRHSCGTILLRAAMFYFLRWIHQRPSATSIATISACMTWLSTADRRSCPRPTGRDRLGGRLTKCCSSQGVLHHFR